MDGLDEGEADGDALGLLDGLALGEMLGEPDGETEGEMEGDPDGEMLGLEDEAGNPQKVRKAEQMLSLPSSGRLIERVGRIQRELGSKSIDSSWALHHWQVAAQRDYGPALCMLGECRANGYLVDEDPDIAAEC